jgi:hypothetical protein
MIKYKNERKRTKEIKKKRRKATVIRGGSSRLLMYMRSLGPPVLHSGVDDGLSLFLLRVVAQGILRCGGQIRIAHSVMPLGDEGGEDGDSTRDEVSLASSSSSWPPLNITQYLDGWYEG